MKTFYDCFPCFVKQALGTLKRSCATDDQIKSTMRAVFTDLADIDFGTAPPVTAQKIHRIIRTEMKIEDPYAEDKRRFNDFAMQLLSEMQIVKVKDQSSFSEKIKLAIAANIIDFGKSANLTESDVRGCFERAQKTTIDDATVLRLQQAVHSADNILYLCDNCGEIVFDRFLIEDMPYTKITCAVRGAPVINDATLDDAKYVGLSNLVKTISNGSDAPGTILDQCSSEFKKAYCDADVIIAKGQGNFETLSDISDKKIFYLLQVKCPVISNHIGYPVGTFVIKEN